MLRGVGLRRQAIKATSDSAAWVLSLWLSNELRFDFMPRDWFSPELAILTVMAVFLQLLIGRNFHLYRRRYRFASFEEVAGVCSTVISVSLILEIVDLLYPGSQLLPRSVPGTAGVLALVTILGARYTWRLRREMEQRAGHVSAERLLIFGAGAGADQIIDALLRNPNSAYFPVGVLDDDPSKSNLRIRGIQVLGGRGELANVAAATGARTLLLAIPSASGSLVSQLQTLTSECALTLKMLPRVTDLVDCKVGVEEIRDYDIVDLLGRREVELDLDEIAAYLSGRRVLVTGAGGSIGSELCRQIYRYAPSKLLMLDRDESALHAVQLSLSGRALLDSDDLLLADIRDVEHIQSIFEETRPEVVFHAAALKHLTLLELNPGEAVKSNVWGTLAVLNAAKSVGVERFVNISTDKAANPSSVLGLSKRITERLTAHAAEDAAGTFISVRFGNVLGSRGSVITAFESQVAGGGPITVTHPDVTRYFMTVQEAVQLVIQSAVVGNPGEVLVLDMGIPISIDHVARQFAAQSATKIDIVYTGLRPGEKLHEDLFATNEVDMRPNHRLISQIPVVPLQPAEAWALDAWAKKEEVTVQLRSLAISSSLSMSQTSVDD